MNTPAPNTPSPDQIVEALDQTGFILEHRVAQVLRSKGFETDLNRPFPDEASGKSREIDVWGYKHSFAKRDPLAIYLATQVICECKNTSNPFVIVGESLEHFGSSGSVRVASAFDPLEFDFDGLSSSSDWELKFGSLPGQLTKPDLLGRQLVRMNRQGSSWRADNSSIFDSIVYPLAKAGKHIVDGFSEPDPAEISADFGFFHLILVTSGPLFGVNIKADEPEVSACRWGSLARTFHAGDLRGSYIFDVVSFPHLAEYLDERVLSIHQSALQKIRENMHLLDPEWLLANKGEPGKKAEFGAWLGLYRAARGDRLANTHE
ncbi:hypothetical protein [Micromonospora sp. NBRC 107095]|uniref:hypothetical protein n=1 Tax=Micromonospora sp. NBRC 107095 TaxID=3032209 RepID=UPI0024A3253F|nr:hypothetical protein [Micromonospora sp. NBRC 107095]GLZ57301.1 hypothetical protein Misp05_08770 [Micromonospora sp. NBRC 107095]